METETTRNVEPFPDSPNPIVTVITCVIGFIFFVMVFPGMREFIQGLLPF